MNKSVFLLIGIYFGIVLTKAETISWFRMQEMFRFQSFHLYGVFMTAVPVAILGTQILLRSRKKALDGSEIAVAPKKYHHGLIIGGTIFGIGWAMTGACPGPLFAQIGSGATVMILTFISALAGTWVYSFFREKLP